MVLFLLLLTPLALLLLLLGLDRLEDAVVAPIERAARVEKLLASEEPEEEIEREVSRLFAPLIPRRIET